MIRVIDLILLFFIYSFIGWCIEVTLKYRQFHRFINRGFFTGPLLPIYGSGAVLITVAVGAISRYESSYGMTFAVSFALCGALEYLASYYMEKRFHARWWDYSQKPMNLNGRVWIGNLALFGLGGVAIIKGMNPVLLGLLGRVPPSVRESAAIGLLAVFAADAVMSHFVLKLVKTSVEQSEADSTEAINREVKRMLGDRSIFYRRFADAYPEVIYRTERIAERMERIRRETERLRREAEQRIDEMNRRIESGREQLSASLEPTSAIKSDIIEGQGRLIDLLYDESVATDEMKALKKEIDMKQNRLKSRLTYSITH